MKKSKAFTFFCLISSLIFVSSCDNSKSLRLQKIQEFNQEHLAIQKPNIDINSFVFDTNLTESLCQENQRSELRNYLTQKEAVEDVINLFNQLECNYGMYPYYGKERFDNAKEKMIEEIVTIESKLDVSELRNMYKFYLSFIKDQHFTIDKQSLHEKKAIYYSENIVMNKDELGYYLVPTKEYVMQLESDIVEINLDQNVKRVLNENGEIIYQLVVIGEKPETFNIILENNKKINVELTRYQESHINKYNIFQFDEINDIPIYRIAEFIESDNQVMLDFISTTSKIIGKDLVILDLRNNIGGHTDIVNQWMIEMFKEPPYGTYIELMRFGVRQAAWSMKYLQLFKKSGYLQFDDNHLIKYPRTDVIKNDTIFIVLMNNRTSSASEVFIDYLHTIENTVFIGVNSAGNIISNRAYQFYTKNSDIKFTYGSSMRFFDDSYFNEYEGFEPDIYYFGEGNVEKLIIKYINN